MEALLRRIGWRRVIVTIACFVAWRAMEQITIAPERPPGWLSLIAGGTPAYSVVALGVQPYIASVIALTAIRALSRTVRTLSDDPLGRRRVERWIRAVTILLAAGQALGYTLLISGDSWIRFTLVAEFTAGTMALVLLGDVLDEHGLGGGYGVYLIYVAGFLPTQIAVIGDYVSFVQANGDGSNYQPLELWLVFVIVLVIASVAVLRTRRTVPLSRRRQHAELRFPLLMSGVLRPVLVANAVMTFPGAISQSTWIQQNWTAYGPNLWNDVAYALVYSAVVLGIACFFGAVDFTPALITNRLSASHLTISDAAAQRDVAKYLRATALRLAFAGGVFLALVVGVVPVVTRIFTQGTFHNGPSVSTTLTIFFPALILAIAAGLQKSRPDVIVLTPRVL